MAEVLDQCELDGITHFPKLPHWMEEVLFEIISVNGLKAITQLVKEVELEK